VVRGRDRELTPARDLFDGQSTRRCTNRLEYP
jgi:hypothetical protein